MRYAELVEGFKHKVNYSREITEYELVHYVSLHKKYGFSEAEFWEFTHRAKTAGKDPLPHEIFLFIIEKLGVKNKYKQQYNNLQKQDLEYFKPRLLDYIHHSHPINKVSTESLNQKIKYLIYRDSMSLNQLASAIGVSSGVTSQWMNGRSKPSIENLYLIADFFDVTIDYLVGRTETYDNSQFLESLKRLVSKGSIIASDILKSAEVPLKTFNAWKSGISTPSSTELSKLADYFNVSIDYLIGRESPAAAQIMPDIIERTWLVMTEEQRWSIHQIMNGMLAADPRPAAVAFCEEESIKPAPKKRPEQADTNASGELK